MKGTLLRRGYVSKVSNLAYLKNYDKAPANKAEMANRPLQRRVNEREELNYSNVEVF